MLLPWAVGWTRVSATLGRCGTSCSNARSLERLKILLALPQGGRAGFSTVNPADRSLARRCHWRTWQGVGRELIQGQVLGLQCPAERLRVTLIIFVRLMSIVKLDIGDLSQVRVSFDDLPYGIPFVNVPLHQLCLKIVASGSLHRRLLRKWRCLTPGISSLLCIERLIQIVSMGYPSTGSALAKCILDTSVMLYAIGALIEPIPVVIDN